MTNALSSVATNLLTGLTKAGADIVSIVTGFVSSTLTTVSEDELTVLSNSVTAMIQAVQAGKTWEQAATAAYNLFYNAEVAEGNKIGLAFLNLIAEIAAKAEADVAGN